MDITKWKSVLVPIEVYTEIKKDSQGRRPDYQRTTKNRLGSLQKICIK